MLSLARKEGEGKSVSTKLLFFDVDGTLLDDRTHTLPRSVAPALEKVKAKGNRIFVNTGRTLCNMEREVLALPLDGCIMGCGTRVICGKETLRCVEYDFKDSMRMRDIIARADIPCVYECDTGIYFDTPYFDLPQIQGFWNFSSVRGINRMITPEDEAFRAVKTFMFAEAQRIEALMAQLAQAGMPYTAIDRGNDGWEVVPASCSKANGMDLIAEHLGVSLEDCYAFGDSHNDLPMLTHVSHSVAVGNAPQDVKEACRYVAPRVEENGIASILETLELM